MLTFILNIIFWSVLFFCGWQISRFTFKEKKIEILLPLSFIIGVIIYLFLLNLLSHFIPITINFYLILGFLLLISLFLFFIKHTKRTKKLEWGINRKERIVIFVITLAIMMLTGFIAARMFGGENLSQFHLIPAATIAGGNFPVMELNMPDNFQVYHYGPNLLHAAILKITGLPIWFAFDSTVFLFSGIILLICFLLARLIIKHNIKAFMVALIAFLAGGLRFIYIFPGLITLFQRFILHQDIAHPFQFLSFVWDARPALTKSLPNLFIHAWGPLGWALFLTIIFVYLNYVLKSDGIRRYLQAFLIIICLSVLALTIETSFVIIALVLLIYPFILFFREKNKPRSKQLIICSLIVLSITSILVLVQGGAITAILRNFLIGTTPMGESMVFNFFKHPWSFLNSEQLLPFYSSGFLMNFGLIYLLIIPASIFVIKHWFKKGLFLILVSFLSFTIPFTISFNSYWQDTINRLFYSVNFIWAILVAIFLFTAIDYFKKSRILKILVIFTLIIICLDGFIFLFSRALYAPRLETIHKDSFWGELKKPYLSEAEAYKWIHKNTTIKDYFLVFNDIKEVGDNFPIDPTYRFVSYAQRLAPIYVEGASSHDFSPVADHPLSFKYRELLKTCDKDILKELKFKYLFVDNNFPSGLEEKCLVNNNLELKFEQGKKEEAIRIYKAL